MSRHMFVSDTHLQYFQVFEYDDEDEPTSPVSHSSSSTTAMYSNLPSPLFSSDTQVMH